MLISNYIIYLLKYMFVLFLTFPKKNIYVQNILINKYNTFDQHATHNIFIQNSLRNSSPDDRSNGWLVAVV